MISLAPLFDSMDKRQLFVCIDLEAITNSQICAIGLTVGDQFGIVHLKREWWIDVKIEKDPKCTEDKESCMCSYCRCKREFWDKHPELVKHMDQEKRDEETVIKEFVECYDGIAKELGVEEKDIKLVTDNPEFDFGLLNSYVKKYCGRGPLRYTSGGQYRSIQDKSDAIWDLGLGKIVDTAVSSIQEHNHFPSNDAEHNYICHLLSVEILDQMKNRFGSEMEKITKRLCNKKMKEIKKIRANHPYSKEKTKN